MNITHMHSGGQTEKRKGEHVDIVLQHRVETTVSNGFESVRFVHQALPELDYAKIKLSTSFLGRKLSAPFMVTGMTGGYPDAQKINTDIASACADEDIVFAVGSQRAMLEDKSQAKTYAVKKAAPSVFLCGNIGAFQLKRYSPKQIQAGLVDAIDADALCVHLNPMQEAVQPEGDTDWSGVLEKISVLCGALSVPVIAKEVGGGISGTVAKELKKAGVAAIDVSGVGGTSWSAVEHFRNGRSGDVFWNWGIPTAEALKQCAKAVQLPLIASGGIRSGLDAAKAIRLGATLAGAASPFLKAQSRGGKTGVQKKIQAFKHELRTAMLLTRSKDLAALRKAELLP
ncbi:MAG: type 2 isopentenyl-diphosphate Delta-isomerase [Candidatus Micrarchaeota archaeon]|nr:type 2 isopentenyl-diphosphate Delta-isomerase [Candidatus Micrarchaeota archaeon]